MAIQTIKAHTDKTAADNKSIGFDFQYYYFLWRLIKLNPYEKLGLEIRDDVHIELNDGSQILIQLKHSIQTKANGNPINLTTRDIDLWKTLSNWSKVICDEQDGRKLLSVQIHYVDKTIFQLTSNKSENKNNSFLSNLSKYQSNIISYDKLIAGIEIIKTASKQDSLLVEYIDDILILKPPVLKAFLKRIRFELEVDDIIHECKLAIKANKIDINRIDDVFKSLDSQIRQDNYYTIEAGVKVLIDFDTFYKKYRRHFDIGRNGSLPIREYTDSLPSKLEDQIFVKQLIDIHDIDSADFELISEFTRFKLKLTNNIDQWLQDGDVTKDEIVAFQNDAINKWKTEYRAAHRNSSSEEDIIGNSLKVIDSMRRKNIDLAGQRFDSELSNGEYYHLSDIPLIGWRNDWETRYK